jgi:two-component system, chemotaxis family, CheB/CheR fusion protein
MVAGLTECLALAYHEFNREIPRWRLPVPAHDEDTLLILEKVRLSCGVDFTRYREGSVRRRIDHRLATLRCPDLKSYVDLLDSDPGECGRLLSDLTIKYTEFFRDRHVFDLLRDRLIPSLFTRRGESDDIAIWSAACATGEETYSIAALVRHSKEFQLGHCGVNILGTDVDPEAIAAARVGTYAKAFLPTLPPLWAEQYFSVDGGLVTASAELKDMVSFYIHDITAPTAIDAMCEIRRGHFDMIVCRNLLIYLERPAQAEVLNVCCDLLKPDGFLVLGTGETVPRKMEAKLAVVDPKAKIYAKLPEGVKGI